MNSPSRLLCDAGRRVRLVLVGLLIGLNVNPIAAAVREAPTDLVELISRLPGNLSAHSVEQRADLQQQVAASLGLKACDVASISQVGLQQTINLKTRLGEDDRDLLLSTHSMRSPGFTVLVDDGTVNAVAAPALRTYRGWVLQDPTAQVAASITQQGQVRAMVLQPNVEKWYIEPVSSVAAGAPADWHVVYRESDVIPTEKTCGVDGIVTLGEMIESQVDESGNRISQGPTGLTEIAFDADVEFYQLHGSSVPDTTADIEMIANFIDLIYNVQVGICYTITGIIVRTVEADPYTSTDSAALLCEITVEWNNSNPLPHDVAHLMTGKEVDGNVIGRAWIGVVCGQVFNLGSCGIVGRANYGISESLYSGSSTSLSNRVILTTHELGHNWSAQHCDGAGDCGVMFSSVNGASVIFGSDSVNSITSHRDSRSCLGPCGASSPDCNTDGVADELEIALGTQEDCDTDGQPDDCQAAIEGDCNSNGRPDGCELVELPGNCCETGHGSGCNVPAIESCVCASSPACCILNWSPGCAAKVDSLGCGSCRGGAGDCNSNGIPDDCDLANSTAPDCNNNSAIDSCESIPPWDFDLSTTIDLIDHAGLADCLGGPSAAPGGPAECSQACLDAFDGDASNTVDLRDFGEFNEQL